MPQTHSILNVNTRTQAIQVERLWSAKDNRPMGTGLDSSQPITDQRLVCNHHAHTLDTEWQGNTLT